jgi:GAF domain-containing protein
MITLEADADLLDEIRALLEGEPDPIANAANIASVIHARVPRLNWAGFYFLKGDTLVLGPFQGLPACTRIPLGRGVCGTAAQQGRTIVVDDVHEFPGHIACDSASMSEIVVPLIVSGRVTGVLDVDSPEPARFGEEERQLMEAIATLYIQSSEA